MKCFIHNETDAQGTCTKCGRAMCKECMKFANYSHTCPSCKKKQLRKRIILSIIHITAIILIFYYDIHIIINDFLPNFYAYQIIIISSGISGVANIIRLIISTINLIIIKKAENEAKGTLIQKIEKNNK